MSMPSRFDYGLYAYLSLHLKLASTGLDYAENLTKLAPRLSIMQHG